MKNQESKEEETQALEDALSPIVNKLIDKNYETSKDKIASQMAPLIGSAIREQIKSQKDDVVDALYPVMGNMISKYVTQSLEDLLDKINTQIQNGLSMRALKRKITAKIKGVSETELLLSEMTSSYIQSVLLIHKETGLVLAHIENQTLNEPEMLASMMTAIRSFVNDWVEQSGSYQELGEIDYGGNKIIIEASGYSYLAVIVQGGAYKTTYDAIRVCLENIVLHHGDAIREFNGDLSVLDQEALKKEMLPLLALQDQEQLPQKKQPIHPLLYLILVSMLGFGGYSYYKHYQAQQLQKRLQNLLYTTPQLTLYRLTPHIEGEQVVLDGEVPAQYYKDLAQKIVKKQLKTSTLQNNIVVVQSFTDPQQISSYIAYLLQGFAMQEGVHLHYIYNYPILTLEGSVWNPSQKEKILKKLVEIKGVQKVYDKIVIAPPLPITTLYFSKGKRSLSTEAQAKLIRFTKKLMRFNIKGKLFITIYSDTLGSKKANALLSQHRAKAIKDFLLSKVRVHNPLSVEIKLSPPKGINPKKQPAKARCATIALTKEDKI